MFRILLLIMLMLAASFSAEAQTDCSVPRIATLANQTVNGAMTVKSGKTCSIRFLSSSGPMFSVEIVQRPSNGTVLASGSSVRYTPRAGFTGSDSFTYARKGLDTRNNPAVRTVRIAVTVVP